MPVLLLLQMPAMMLAMGGAAKAAVLLGKRNTREADGVFSASVGAGLVLSLFFAVFTPFLPGVLAMALAGNETLAALAQPYIAVNFGGIPILTLAIIFCYFMNADNHPQLGSMLFIIANVVNLALDLVFLKGLKIGMAGSALATVIGYFAGMVTVVFYFRSKHRMLHLRKPAGETLRYAGLAAKAGIPSAAFTLMSALKSVIINSAIVRILGNDPMAVYSVCANAVLIAELCVGGIIGLVQNSLRGEGLLWDPCALQKGAYLQLSCDCRAASHIPCGAAVYCRTFRDYPGGDAWHVQYGPSYLCAEFSVLCVQ